jgi:hypothetical protein
MAWHRFRRVAFFVAAGVIVTNICVAIAACSSSNSSFGGDDTSEAGPKPDGGKEGSTPPPPPPPAPIGDSGRPGNCSVVKGACDIVSQNCPSGQECVVDNTSKTQCVPIEATESLEMGSACCPGGQGNPCLPGLSCIGNPCVDGGPKTGRCSPACCKDDDVECGKSIPEGISGACNLTIVDGKGNELYQTCSYQQRCIPFGIEPCKPGEICLIEDKLGTSGCLASFGKTNGQACGFANDCADGLICLTVGDAGVCHYACLTPGSTHPFDAGGLDNSPGHGGCPPGETCQGLDPKTAPGWLSVCSP